MDWGRYRETGLDKQRALAMSPSQGPFTATRSRLRTYPASLYCPPHATRPHATRILVWAWLMQMYAPRWGEANVTKLTGCTPQ